MFSYVGKILLHFHKLEFDLLKPVYNIPRSKRSLVTNCQSNGLQVGMAEHIKNNACPGIWGELKISLYVLGQQAIRTMLKLQFMFFVLGRQELSHLVMIFFSKDAC